MEQRLRALEQLVRSEAGGGPGLDGLLDLLLGLYHELSSAPLRRERNVAQFLSWGEWSGALGTPRRDPCAPPPRPSYKDAHPRDFPQRHPPSLGFNTCHRTPQPAHLPAVSHSYSLLPPPRPQDTYTT
jgi:hypothetical protein